MTERERHEVITEEELKHWEFMDSCDPTMERLIAEVRRLREENELLRDSRDQLDDIAGVFEVYGAHTLDKAYQLIALGRAVEAMPMVVSLAPNQTVWWCGSCNKQEVLKNEAE